MLLLEHQVSLQRHLRARARVPWVGYLARSDSVHGKSKLS